MVNPKRLCRQHLLGEHNELHMLAGCLNKNKSVKGYLANGLIEPQSIERRHKELSQELLNRGYKHESPLFVLKTKPVGYVEIEESLKELKRRCKKCLTN